METTFEVKIERAVLVGLNADCFRKDQTATDETLEELEALLETAGGFCTAYRIRDILKDEAVLRFYAELFGSEQVDIRFCFITADFMCERDRVEEIGNTKADECRFKELFGAGCCNAELYSACF